LHRFSDVFFVDATSSETINDDLRNIALAKGAGDSAEAALRWFSRKTDEWLLFFDNADDTTLNLLNYFPRSSNGNIIATTRNNEARIHAPRSNWRISGLAPDDAKDLLLDVSGVREPNDEAIEVAKTIVKASSPFVSFDHIDNFRVGTRSSRTCHHSSWRVYLQDRMFSRTLY
jgi:hypothetical protein